MYTPQFSDDSCVSVRRLAWALGIPMSKAVSRLVDQLPGLIEPGKVCLSCKDQTKCGLCVFSGKVSHSPFGLEV